MKIIMMMLTKVEREGVMKTIIMMTLKNARRKAMKVIMVMMLMKVRKEEVMKIVMKMMMLTPRRRGCISHAYLWVGGFQRYRKSFRIGQKPFYSQVNDKE